MFIYVYIEKEGSYQVWNRIRDVKALVLNHLLLLVVIVVLMAMVVVVAPELPMRGTTDTLVHFRQRQLVVVKFPKCGSKLPS